MFMRAIRLQVQMGDSKPTPKAPQSRNDWRVLALWVVVLLAGLAGLTGLVSATRGAGALGAVLGAGGCAWEVARWLRHRRLRRQALQKAEAHAEMQAAQKIKRQARQTQQQTRRQQHKTAQAQAKQAHEQQRYAARQAQVERAALENAQRASRFEQVAAEAERLQCLDAVSFRAEVKAIFALRGLQPADKRDSANQNDGNTSLLRLAPLPDNHLEIAQFAGEDTPVAVADVEALEQARQQADADRAYLIGRNGFTPAAVRLAQRFPLTFVEPQLLAQWKITSEIE